MRHSDSKVLTEKVIELFNQGKTLEQINLATGLNIRSIAMRLSKAGLRHSVRQYKKREHTKEELCNILNESLGLELTDLDRLSHQSLTLLIEKFTT